MTPSRVGLVMVCLYVGAAAGELPAEIQAKFVRILASSAGSGGKVCCHDPGFRAELGKAGLAHDPAAKVAWAASEAEVKELKNVGKLVICGRLEWLSAGGSVAIVEEAGKPQVYLHMGNIAASGVPLSDAVLKIGKKF